MTSRRNSSRIIFSSSSSKTSSTCAIGSGLADHFSTPGTSDGALDARKKRKRKIVKREIKPLSNEWYWNEFDDDDDREEPYTVLVRPSTANSTDDPSEQSLSAFILSSIPKLFCCAQNKAHPREYSPLLGEHTEPDSESDSEVEVGNGRMMGHYQDYATFGHVDDSQNVYSASHVGFLVVSFLMLVITGAIAVGESLSGHKHRYKNIGKNIVIDLSVFVGVLVSLISGTVGLTIFLVRGSRASWLHRFYVWTTFVVVCAGSGAILTMVATTEAQ